MRALGAAGDLRRAAAGERRVAADTAAKATRRVGTRAVLALHPSNAPLLAGSIHLRRQRHRKEQCRDGDSKNAPDRAHRMIASSFRVRSAAACARAGPNSSSALDSRAFDAWSPHGSSRRKRPLGFRARREGGACWLKHAAARLPTIRAPLAATAALPALLHAQGGGASAPACPASGPATEIPFG